ncbi:hypothetical protein WJX72_004279 [[Myrmecia] bisecta]|uniref:Protein-tyrosine sulfotransferase n=1 Tax=[Myrmecia] bisecta TaxID=41462 RepID=A0AAW1PPW9_9CHLO
MAARNDTKGKAARPASAQVVDGCEWALQHNAPSLSKQQLPFLMHQGNPGCMPDEDASLLPQLKGIHFQPVFISGVHRSGTSFLYKALSDVLPVAYLRMFDIVNYNRLLAAYKAGTIAEEAAAIDAYLAAVGLKSRLIDSVEASHAAAEEHGFVLMAHSRRGTNYLCTANSQLFSEMCAKLVVVQACPSGVVLMKNPFDHGREAEIARLYPNAKFIHIQRDLAACLSSFISIMDVMWPQVGGIDPWIYSLLSGCQYIFAVFILLDLIVGHQRTMYQVARNLVATTLAIKASAARAFTEIRAREPHRVHDLTYEQLMVDPEGEVGRIAAFLGLEPNATELARLGGRVAPRASRLHPSITEAMEAHAAADTGRVADRSELSAWTTIKSLVPVMAPGDALRAVKRQQPVRLQDA